MFVFHKDIRESLVTSGVLISCGLFVAEAIRGIYWGIWNVLFGIFLLVLVAAVLRGHKLAYLVTRYLWRAVAFGVLVGFALNPLAWSDVAGGVRRLLYLMCVWLLISIVAFCLSYCLAEHAKLRGLKGAEKWRSFP